MRVQLEKASKPCLCCVEEIPWWYDRTCPRCGMTFQRGSTSGGWEGFEEHWKSHHSNEERYEEVWFNLCDRHRKYTTVITCTTDLHDPIVLELWLIGGTADIGYKVQGKDRQILDRIAARIGLSEEEKTLYVGDFHPLNLPHRKRNGWEYSVNVAIQHMRYRSYAGYDKPFVLYSAKRGVLELSPSGMLYGQMLAEKKATASASQVS